MCYNKTPKCVERKHIDLGGVCGGNVIMAQKTQSNNIRKLTYLAVMTALVIVLQHLGQFIRLGQFSVSLVLAPIVLGAVIAGSYGGFWLGAVFGVAVIMTGDANLFFAVSVPGTIITVMLKGILCGLAAALVYRAFSRFNKYLAVFLAAVICPIVNTGVFLLGCVAFFMEPVTAWAGSQNVVAYMFLGLAGGNFLFELAFNIFLCPIIIRLINILPKSISYE